jgi:hypothetical protein
MSYMNCPRCGLKLRLRASFLAVEHCPRCLARSRTAVPMLISGSRAWPQAAAAPPADLPPAHGRAAV